MNGLSSTNTIAKNTLALYLRSICLMIIGLYTSRVILQSLGFVDFGLYNVVGGIVAMFSFISGSISNATSRFITIAIGKKEKNLINTTFGNIKILFYLLSIVVILLGETLGLWFLYYKMQIPIERKNAAFWVYQISILSTVLSLITVPYNAAIIAHEKMSVFAYMSLFEAICKLVACYLLYTVSYDRLIVYAIFLFFVEFANILINVCYCRKHFVEVKTKPCLHRQQMNEILKVSGWALSDNISWIMNTQGLNLLLNTFFGPVVNAARGIALQVQGVMSQFIVNFQTAVNPQITKQYAISNYSRMHSLVCLSSKFSFFLLFFMTLPVFLEAPFILKIWLCKVPNGTVFFLQIILVYALISTLSNPLWIAVLATAKLKRFQTYDNIIRLLVVPVSYLGCKFIGMPAYWVFLILLLSHFLSLMVRIYIVLPLIKFSYKSYINRVIIPIFLVTLLAPIIPICFYMSINIGLFRFIILTLVSLFSTGIFIWYLGLNSIERSYILEKILAKLLSTIRR